MDFTDAVGKLKPDIARKGVGPEGRGSQPKPTRETSSSLFPPSPFGLKAAQRAVTSAPASQ